VLVALIFLFLIKEGGPAFFEVPLSSLLRPAGTPSRTNFGLISLVAGSLLVTVGAAAMSLPLGLATAVFIAEIAPRGPGISSSPFVEVLAGNPLS
jgi:phosphate transport system permease protein